jgi:hypothetical protein
MMIAIEAPGRVKADIASWHRLRDDEAAFRSGAALLARLPGPILCEDPLLCHVAGKPTAMNPGYLGDQIRLDRRPLCDMLGPIEQGRFAAVVVAGPDLQQNRDGGRFPRPVLDALRTRYRIAMQTSAFTILLPAPEAAGSLSCRAAAG